MIVETVVRGRVPADAAEISDLIASKNNQYSATYGEDLLKATNKTAKSQANLGRIIGDYDDYKNFVDDLYFLFHESVGKRLEGRMPDSFKDVGTLRTDLRHDVDHGEKGKVKGKERKTGKIFQKYGGAPSPEGLGPAQLRELTQSLLLNLRASIEHYASFGRRTQ
jgi:hypothetical protein